MTPEEAVPLLARWIAELQCDLADAQHHNQQLEHRVRRLEHHIRQQAIARRHLIRNGHRTRELV